MIQIFRNGILKELTEDEPIYYRIIKARERARKIIEENNKCGVEDEN